MTRQLKEQAKVVEDLIADLEDRLSTAQECIKPALQAQIRQQQQALAWIRRQGSGTD